MKKTILFVIVWFTLAGRAQTGETDAVLNTFVNYNFSARQDLKNLTPVVNFGWEKSLFSQPSETKADFSWILNINPYTASTIGVKDSSSFLPALMLPGNFGLTANSYLIWNWGKNNNDQAFILIPLNFGFKVIGDFKDSGVALTQHNIRTGFAYEIKDLFSINIQHSWGWHNLTSESEKNYKKFLPGSSNTMKYLTVTLQSRFNIAESDPVYITLSWKGLRNSTQFSGLPNSKIISVGFYKSFSFKNGDAKNRRDRKKAENFNYGKHLNLL